MVSELDKVYLAGFFDGEGCIQISPPRKSKGYSLIITLGQSDRTVLDWAQSVWGGSVGKGSHDTFTWRIHTNLAAKFLADIEPFLRVKKEQAKIAIEFQSVQRIGQRLSPEYREWCETLRQRLYSLCGNRNHIGRRAAVRTEFAGTELRSVVNPPIVARDEAVRSACRTSADFAELRPSACFPPAATSRLPLASGS